MPWGMVADPDAKARFEMLWSIEDIVDLTCREKENLTVPQRVWFASSGKVFIGLTSLLLGVVSNILSYMLTTHFCYGFLHFYLNSPDNVTGPTWRVVVFQITEAPAVAFLIGWVGIAAATGSLGYWLARKQQEGLGRLHASAARFSIWGLVGVAINLIIIASLLGYRAYRWFFG